MKKYISEKALKARLKTTEGVCLPQFNRKAIPKKRTFVAETVFEIVCARLSLASLFSESRREQDVTRSLNNEPI